jgi:predicted transcriptional regulator
MNKKAELIYNLTESGKMTYEIAEMLDMPISKVSEFKKEWMNEHDYLANPNTLLSALGGMSKFSRC